ncbi:MAG TPA: extracellular solute-binding protein [Ruminiclostridium sp.]
MIKKSLSMLLVVAMLFTALVGCGKSDNTAGSSTTTTGEATIASEATTTSDTTAISDNTQKAGEFTVYTYYADAAKIITDEAVRLMKEKYPNVKLNIEHRSDSDGAVLKTRSAVGELPDIFECTGTLTDTFIQSKDIIPLNSAMEKMDFENLYMPNIFAGLKSADGNYYAVQASAPSAALIYYNKKVFADNGLTPPKNYPEFLSLVQKLKAADIIPLSLFAQQKWPGLQLFDIAVTSQEPLGITGFEGGVKKPSEKAYTDAAKKLYDLVKAGLLGKGAFNTNASQAFELLKLGKAGMLINGSWYFADAKEYIDNIGYFEYNPFADPGSEETSKWNASGGVNTPGGYAISAKTKDPEFAKEIMLNYVLSRSKAEVTETAGINILKEDVQPKVKRGESYQKFADNVKNYKSFTKFEWSLKTPDLITLLEDSSEKLLTGSYLPEKFITDLEKALENTPK